MRSLAVFDLDGTLIPYDSFGRIARGLIAKQPTLAVSAALRRIGILSRATLAERMHVAASQQFADQDSLQRIVDTVAGDVPAQRREFIEHWRRRGAHMVLLSASPHDYVAPVAEALGFDEGFGSRFSDGRYRHLYGVEKLHFIDVHYPATEWTRAFAIADQPSDDPLLAAFREVERVKVT